LASSLPTTEHLPVTDVGFGRDRELGSDLDRAPLLDLVDRYCSAADPDAGLEADRYVD